MLPVSISAWAASPGEACRDQAAVAEVRAGIPGGLLVAIGKRESGLPDATSGTILPWPWAVNQDGTSHFAASATAAVAFVVNARARRARSIDVGYMQISLLHHPHAFDSLEETLDPVMNTAYAARFLAPLRDATGSWSAAVAAYHSADPIRGNPYRDRVFATWAAHVNSGEATGLSSTSLTGSSRVAMGMRIWVPGGGQMLQVSTRLGRLPAVITPQAFARGPAFSRNPRV